MRKRKALQILTIAAALMLLSAYVVYSQLKQAATVASSSKSMVLTNKGAVSTNTIQAIKDSRSTTIATNSGTTNGKADMFFPGSKSGAVFVPQAQSTGK